MKVCMKTFQTYIEIVLEWNSKMKTEHYVVYKSYQKNEHVKRVNRILKIHVIHVLSYHLERFKDLSMLQR